MTKMRGTDSLMRDEYKAYDSVIDALPGRILDHHRFLLGTHLRMIEYYEEGRAALEVDLDKALEALEDGRRGAALAP